MGTIKNRIQYQNNGGRSFFPNHSEVNLISQKIVEKYSSTNFACNPLELESIFKQLMEYVSAENFNQIPKKLWKRSTWVFWYKEKNIITDQKFFSELEKYIENTNSITIVRSLISIFIREYRNHPNDVKKIGELIVRRFSSKTNSLSHWHNLHKNYEFFDYEKSLKNLSELLNSYSSINDFFIELGFNEEQKSIGIIESVYLNFLELFSNNLDKYNDYERNFKKFIDFTIDGQSLRFPQHKEKIIESLLLPWSNKKPDEELKNKIIKFLIDNFGDIRIKPQNWIGVKEDAKKVFRKWLSGATLEQFFEIISEWSPDKRWEYRRAFWMAYYSNDLINDAWVVFEKKYYNEAKNRLDKNISFGIVKSNKNKAAIIIKIGNFIFSEWSNVGRCRAWNENDALAPKLYKLDYLEDELTTSSLVIKEAANGKDGIPHRHSETYTWQKTLSNFIYENIGISMPSFKYQLK
jgi:hypothetical protein